MKLEDQVCSLELAKRLKELDVKQDGFFCWVVVENKSWIVVRSHDEEGVDWSYSAFTVAELGEMLPRTRKYKYESGQEVENDLRFGKTVSGDYFVHTGVEQKFGKTEADARANMFIYLLENKLI